MIAAILPDIAADLVVSVALAGSLISIFSLAYALSSPILTALTGSVNRRKLLLAAMTIFLLGNLLAASMHSYWGLALARVLLACAAGLYTPNANALAGSLVPPERRRYPETATADCGRRARRIPDNSAPPAASHAS